MFTDFIKPRNGLIVIIFRSDTCIQLANRTNNIFLRILHLFKKRLIYFLSSNNVKTQTPVSCYYILLNSILIHDFTMILYN